MVHFLKLVASVTFLVSTLLWFLAPRKRQPKITDNIVCDIDSRNVDTFVCRTSWDHALRARREMRQQVVDGIETEERYQDFVRLQEKTRYQNF